MTLALDGARTQWYDGRWNLKRSLHHRGGAWHAQSLGQATSRASRVGPGSQERPDDWLPIRNPAARRGPPAVEETRVGPPLSSAALLLTSGKPPAMTGSSRR